MLTYAPSILDLSSHLDLDLVSGFLSSFLAESGVLCSVFSRFEFCRHFLLGPSPAGKTHHEPMLSHPFSTWYVLPQFQSFQLISHQVYAPSFTSGRSSLCCLCLKPKSQVRCSKEMEHVNGLVNILNSIHRTGQVSVVLQT